MRNEDGFLLPEVLLALEVVVLPVALACASRILSGATALGAIGASAKMVESSLVRRALRESIVS